MAVRPGPILLSLALLAIAPLPARSAAFVVDLTWDSCVGPTEKISSGPGYYSLYMSLIGVDFPTTGYEVMVIYGDSGQSVPDAWRFDVAGCQGMNAVTIDHLPPPAESKSCPAFMGASEPSLQISQVGFLWEQDTYARSLMRIILGNNYPTGVPTPDPNTRYFLGRFQFDHANSVEGPGSPGVSCGGFETPICFKTSDVLYLDMDQNALRPARESWSQAIATMNDVQGTTCAAVPVRATTWGQIKGQYRN